MEQQKQQEGPQSSLQITQGIMNEELANKISLQQIAHEEKRNLAQKQLNWMKNKLKRNFQKKSKSESNLAIFQCHGKKVKYSSKSLLFLNGDNCFRKSVVWIIESIWFERFITFVIILNTISLTQQDYSFRETGQKSEDMKAYILNLFEYIFAGVFFTEFFLKVIAMGFIFEQRTYLRDAWNIIDFLVVITRTIRILRPLRNINSIKGMRVLVASLLDSLPDLGNVVIFLLFIIILFAILGLQLFIGVIENRCRMTKFPVGNVWKADDTYTALCVDGDDSTCPPNRFCGNPAKWNLPNQDDLSQNDDLNYGYTNFDNILMAISTIFQALTTEGWTKLIFIFENSVNFIIVYIYFIMLIFLGAFFVVNLILAVINESFLKTNEKRKSVQNNDEDNEVEGEQIPDEADIELRRAIKKKKLAQVVPIITEVDENLTPLRQNGVHHAEPEPEEPYEHQNQRIEEEQQKEENQSNQSNQAPQVPEGEGNGTNQIQDEINPAISNESKKQLSRFKRAQIFVVESIIETKAFMIFSTFIILLNTASLAMDRYPIDPLESYYLDLSNTIFTIIFTYEMLLKIFGYGILPYFRDGLNIFDTLIVVVSILDLVLSSANVFSGGGLVALSAFRTLRLFRMFKLARSWETFRRLISAIIATLAAISNFVILLLLFMLITSLLGMELFAYQVKVTDENNQSSFPRQNFNDLGNAMITIFILLTNEQWNQITYNYMRGSQSIYPIFYFTAVVIIGNFILLKLFIAILIYNFGQQNEQTENRELRESLDKSSQIAPVIDTQNYVQDIEQQKPLQQERILKSETSTPMIKAQIVPIQSNAVTSSAISGSLIEKRRSFRRSKNSQNWSGDEKQIILVGKSFYIFGQNNCFRMFITVLVSNKNFEIFILMLITTSSILLAIDDPFTMNTSEQEEIFYYIDISITSIFILEALMKCVSQGLLINGPNSYLRSLGNLLDLLVIVFSSLNFNRAASGNYSKVKILRVIRVLRPLRIIARNEGLKIAISALINSITQMINLTMFCLIFFLLFGILGVNQFKGSYYYCTIENVDTKWDCFDVGGNWINHDYNFDNIMNAMVTLFVLATTEGWIDIMYQGTDSRGIGLNPQKDARTYWCLFFIGFVIIGSFFALNLFAGVIVDAFLQEKDKLIGYFYLSKDAQEWVSVRIRNYQSKPKVKVEIPLESQIRRKVYRITSSKIFEMIVFIFILINTILLMIQFQRQPAIISSITIYGNYFCLGIFALEALLKIIAESTTYFKQGWNLFDFIIVILTVVGVVLEQTGVLKSFGTATSVLRSFRIVRVLRLVKKAKSLRMMFQTFITTLPDLANIGGLLGIILFIFAVTGMNLFPFVKRHSVGVTDQCNFSSFLVSFFTLFKSSTGEDWNLIQADLARNTQPNNICFDVSNYQDYVTFGANGCGNSYAYLFYIAFMILFSLIMLNLFVAVIIEGFQKTNQDENSPVKPADIENFELTWSQFDKEATGWIPVNQLTQLLLLLPQPLGWVGKNKSVQQQRVECINLELPVYLSDDNQHCYYYYDVLKALSDEYMYAGYKIEEPLLQNGSLIKQKLNAIEKKSYTKQVLMKQTDFHSGEVIATAMIQKRWTYLKLMKMQRNSDDLPNTNTKTLVRTKSINFTKSDHMDQEGLLNQLKQLSSKQQGNEKNNKQLFRKSVTFR